MFDVIVVGARCAGATTAMLLARAGHSVLLMDRAPFPSDTMSTHYVHQPVIARLARWGLLERLRRTGCPPLDSAHWTLEDVVLDGCSPPVDGIRAAYGPRRYVLDTLLAEAAERAGADFRPRSRVIGLVQDGDRVAGVRAVSPDGTEYTEHAKAVIGADGINSTVAKLAGAERYHERPTRTCVYYTYWADMESAYELHIRNGHGIGVVPTNGDLVMVAMAWHRELLHEVMGDIEGSYLTALKSTSPSLCERVSEATRAERFVGTGNLPNFFRRSAGPGWALVGDAGYHKDPAGAYGISDAVLYGELLAEHLDCALADHGDIDAALRAYVGERDERAFPTYEFNYDMAGLEPPEEQLSLLRELRDDQQRVDQFFGLISGLIPPQDFFGAAAGNNG